MKKIIYILLTMSLLSCDTLVDDLPLSRFPEIRAKLVMTAFISPNDTAIIVNLRESTPLFGKFKTAKNGPFYVTPTGDTIYYDYNRNDIVNNAIVKISDGNKSMIIPYDSKRTEYIISTKNFKIEAGKTYTLTAENSLGKVEATTIVPKEIVNINNIKIDTASKIVEIFEQDSVTKQFKNKKINSTGYKIQYDWQDVPDTENYYFISGFLQFFHEVPTTTNGKDVIYKRILGQYRISWSNLFFDTKAFIDDFNKNGQNIFSPVGDIYENSQFYGSSGISINGKIYNSKPIEKDSRKMVLKVLNLSKEFYDYEISLYKTIDSNGNPFAEPTPIYTNIKNGLGCFAGYNTTTKEVELK